VGHGLCRWCWCIPGASSLNHSRVRDMSLAKYAVSPTDSSDFGTCFGRALSFFIVTVFRFVILFRFFFKARAFFEVALSVLVSSSSESLFLLWEARFFAPFFFVLSGVLVSSLNWNTCWWSLIKSSLWLGDASFFGLLLFDFGGGAVFGSFFFFFDFCSGSVASVLPSIVYKLQLYIDICKLL